ncbi:MAG: glycoside hydrolase family 15 protein [Gemmatimonadota bacterium]|nr:glycoside hydrolase family 15 protein [Gemmatimonadota bacterium]
MNSLHDVAASLELGLIGNGSVAALIDRSGTMVWGCLPRLDGDPTFCSLLKGESDPDHGFFAIELCDVASVEQEYLMNTAVLVTRAVDSHGGEIEITDFSPRFRQYGRVFCPMSFVRRVKRVSGNPRVRVRVRPSAGYGERRCTATFGSNHIRYVGGPVVLRLTTDASIMALLEENPIRVEDTLTFLLGPDETVQESVRDVGRHFMEQSITYWRGWVRSLAIPFEWQDAVIRAAITLKLNVVEDTGAIVAAVTTSIPEAPDSGRNWDYRYCWVRDAYFVVNALNRLGATRTMERYLSFILGIIATTESGRLAPLYGITGGRVPDEHPAPSLTGYRGMGPVRIGNQAHIQEQHDVYGSAILAAPHVFFDRRLVRSGDEVLLTSLEVLGENAAALFDKPDAGIWELRGVKRVHTFSAMMCWAGCDRLARISKHLGLRGKAEHWSSRAAEIHSVICARAWSRERQSFMATLDGDALDASVLRMNEIGFLNASDPRFSATLTAVERELKRDGFIRRYSEADDFGTPENAFIVCTFWYINALFAIGRCDEARELFEQVLSVRTRHGLLAEDLDPRTGEQWGNFVQTYSMVGIIDSAGRLSARWDQAY